MIIVDLPNYSKLWFSIVYQLFKYLFSFFLAMNKKKWSPCRQRTLSDRILGQTEAEPDKADANARI